MLDIWAASLVHLAGVGAIALGVVLLLVGLVAHGFNMFNYPAFTIESRWQTPTRVKWMNQLVDANGNPIVEATIPSVLERPAKQ